MLHCVVGACGHVVLHLGQLGHELRVRREQVPYPPPGHREGLGERLDHDQLVVAGPQEGDVGRVVDYPVIDLVGDQPQVVCPGELNQLVPLPLVHVAARGVAGEVVQYRNCAVVDDLLEVLDRRDEPVLEPAWVERGLATADDDVWRVEGEVRLGDHHLVPGVDDGEEDVQEGVGPAHGDADVGLVQCGDAVVPHLRYLLPQRGQPRGGGVLVPPLPHRSCESLDREFWGLEVRLPQAELHGVVTGHVEHPPDPRWTNALRAVGESHHDLRTSVLGF